jgi:hypothetical protein
VSQRSVFYREAPVLELRQIKGEDDRTYELVFATEAPVNVGYPVPEVLRMKGARLNKLRRNPVVLDTHVQGIRSILGCALKGEPRVEGTRLVAKVRLDPTPEGDAAKARLDSGSLRTASIGYTVDWKKTRELREGETDGDVVGPALIRNQWEPFELTLCPVPADETAVRLRSFQQHTTGRGRRKASGPMSKNSRMRYQDLPEPAGDEQEHDEGGDEDETTPAPKPERRSQAPKPAPKQLRPESSAEREARDLAARSTSIRSITPKGLEDVADKAIMDGLDLEDARRALQKAYAKRRKPLGTPEPTDEPEIEDDQEPEAAPAGARSAPTKKPAAKGAKGDEQELTADTVLRSLTGTRS